MKPLLEVEKTRIAYHKNANKNTVHRSSLIAPRIDGATTNITFLNHFLIKRNYKEVALKITSLNSLGKVVDSISIEINEPKVYSINLEDMFDGNSEICEYLIEFYSEKNLFIPFPAVMVNHIGADFINSVHSFNRVLNDIFENDSVNAAQVYESSIDYVVDKRYDTFFNFASGPFKPTREIEIALETAPSEVHKKSIPTDIERLTNRNYFISNIFVDAGTLPNGTLKILQPKQELFYGRLLAGVIDRETKAFSANHSYYDSSNTKEYFDNDLSRRTYPYFADALNQITMYPIMSPSLLSVHIEISDDSKHFSSQPLEIRSPSQSPIMFDIDKIVHSAGLKNVTAFEVVARAINGSVPTRVNHQLIYGPKNSGSLLRSSINVSLINRQVFTPPTKTGFTWGQMVVHSDYISHLGICFNESAGTGDEVEVTFYGENGLIKNVKSHLQPGTSLIMNSDEFKDVEHGSRFIWYVAKSKRPDLSAQSFHSHKLSHNSSGEHSF
jgi:hypothetical protein